MSHKVTGATWTAEFNDGTSLGQYDVHSPLVPDGELRERALASGEVPFRAIDWSRAVRLVFESQWVRQGVDLAPVPPGFRRSLRSRHWLVPGGTMTLCFMIVRSREGEDPTDDSVAEVFYWLPDGTTHHCPHLNCPDVAQYGCTSVHDPLNERGKSLTPVHAGFDE